MQAEPHACRLDHLQRHELQSFGVESHRVGDCFGFGACVIVLETPAAPARPGCFSGYEAVLHRRVDGCAQRVEPLNDLVAQASDCFFVQVRHVVKHDDLAATGQSAKVRIALGQDYTGSGASGRNCRGESSRPTPDDEHVRFADHWRLARGFIHLYDIG